MADDLFDENKHLLSAEERAISDDISAVAMEISTEDSEVDKAAMICNLEGDDSEKSSDENEVESVEMTTYNKDDGQPDVQDFKKEDSDVEVEMNYTPDSDRVGLEGQYLLRFGTDSLQLVDPQDKNVTVVWKYCFIRRFGYNQPLKKFMIEAGKKCQEYQGKFDFSITVDPRQMIEALKDKQGCSLSLMKNGERISHSIF